MFILNLEWRADCFFHRFDSPSPGVALAPYNFRIGLGFFPSSTDACGPIVIGPKILLKRVHEQGAVSSGSSESIADDRQLSALVFA